MAWTRPSWDEIACSFPVLQITDMRVLGANASSDMELFEYQRDLLETGLVSCRLPHDYLKESMLLEEHGFRFIEMVYTPELVLSNLRNEDDTDLLVVSRTNEADMPRLLDIARTSFQSERFKMDPRLHQSISEQRFQNWVASSLYHVSQELYTIRDGVRIIAFFITELQTDGTCYWHLNAVAPDAQRQGYGRRVWRSMLNLAVCAGAKCVRSSIAARNYRVVNLYARLGFTFSPPSMTFHWVRSWV